MRIISFLFIAFLLSSCAYFQNSLQKPEVKLKKVDVKDMTFNDANFVFNFAVKNPNKMPLAVDQITYNLQLNGKPFTQGVYDKKIDVGPETSTSVALPIRVKYEDLMQSISDYLQNRTVQYKLDGSIKVGIFSIPIDKTGEVELETTK